jgi:hypothetical protein
MAATDRGSRAERLAQIERMPRSELREEWRRLNGSSPPNFSRDLFIRALTYRVQELAEGGLSRVAQRKLGAEMDAGKEGGTIELNLRPGARLVREWRGRVHTVAVTKVGFEHDGQSYRSLSEVARAITGTRWSGPRFFSPTRRDREPARG